MLWAREQGDDTVLESSPGTSDVGYNVVNPASELAYLFHVELGNKGFYKANGVPWAVGTGVTAREPFRNVENNVYREAPEFAPNHDPAWRFATLSGLQGGDGKNHMRSVWPVRSKFNFSESQRISDHRDGTYAHCCCRDHRT